MLIYSWLFYFCMEFNFSFCQFESKWGSDWMSCRRVDTLCRQTDYYCQIKCMKKMTFTPIKEERNETDPQNQKKSEKQIVDGIVAKSELSIVRRGWKGIWFSYESLSSSFATQFDVHKNRLLLQSNNSYQFAMLEFFNTLSWMGLFYFCVAHPIWMK